MSDFYQTPQSNPEIPQPVLSEGEAVIPGLENVQFPLQFKFKVLAFAPQIQVFDASGKSILYVKQKLFKFKEKVEIFTDKTRKQKLATIQANKVIDWSARYFFETVDGKAIGSVGRKGMRSLWKASYEVFNPGDEVTDYRISEENPAAKIFDSLLGEIPILGFATTFLFHPKYAAFSNAGGQPVMRLTKKPAVFQGKFELDVLGDLNQRQQLNLILSFLMLVLLERARG